MRRLSAVFHSLLIAATLGNAAGARGEPGTGATRLSVAGGPARAYATYGHAAEPELYAPVAFELRRLHLTFEARGDTVAVSLSGDRVATWSVVRNPDDLPETAQDPCVLILGRELYLPLRALSRLAGLEV